MRPLRVSFGERQKKKKKQVTEILMKSTGNSEIELIFGFL